MALDYGFFNAAVDASSSSGYDRDYNADNITEFYEYTIGSGVCIDDDEDSFLVTYSNKVASVAPGYLFIRGRWLKNDSTYNVALPDSGTYAIVVTLDTTNRLFTITYKATASDYGDDALCLAVVNIDSSTVTDTRDNSDVCGIIHSTGEISREMENAISYLSDEVGELLDDYVDESTALVAQVTAAKAAADTAAASYSAPAIGEIKYSLQSPGNKWLACDGTLISADDYPTLVGLLNDQLPVDPDWGAVAVWYSGSSTPTPRSVNGVYVNSKMWFVWGTYLMGVDPTDNAVYSYTASSEITKISLGSWVQKSKVWLTYKSGYLFFGMADSSMSTLYCAYGTFDGETFTLINNGTTGLCDVSYYATGLFSTCGEGYVNYDGTNVSIACRVFEDTAGVAYSTIETWTCAMPIASNTWSRSVAITYNTVYGKYITTPGFNPAYGLNGNYFLVSAYETASGTFKPWLRSFPDNVVSILGDTEYSDYASLFPYSGLLAPVTDGTNTVYAARVNGSGTKITGFTVYYFNNSTLVPTSYTISYVVAGGPYMYSNSVMKRALYVRGFWFFAMKTGSFTANTIFYTDDITDSSRMKRLEINSLPIQTITSYTSSPILVVGIDSINDVILDYDSSDNALLIYIQCEWRITRNSSPVPAVYCAKLDLDRFADSYGDDAYLPELAVSGFQGYIKAVSG